MDRFNSRTFLKSSNIDDGYWRFAMMLSNQLEHAIQEDNDPKILRLLDSPKLFTGRA